MTRFIAVLAVISGCAHVSDRTPWTAATDAYRDADVRMLLAPDESTIASLIEARAAAAKQLRSTSEPARASVLAGLRSRIDTVREAASVFAIAREWFDREVVDAALGSYDASVSFLARYYVARLVVHADQRLVRERSVRVLELLRTERDEQARLAWLPILGDLDPGIALQVCADFMRTGSPRLQRLTYAMARSRSREFTESLRACLQRSGALDAMRLMAQLEAEEKLMEGAPKSEGLKAPTGGI